MTILTSTILTIFLFLAKDDLVSSALVRGDEHFRSQIEKRSPDVTGLEGPFLAPEESRQRQEFVSPEELEEEKKNGRRVFMYIGKRENPFEELKRSNEPAENPHRRSRIYIGKKSDVDAYDLDGSDSLLSPSIPDNVRYDIIPSSYDGSQLSGRQMRLPLKNYFQKKRSARLYIG